MKSDDTQAGTEIFCAHNFVKELLQKGCETSCDETNNNFNRKLKLPAYFDLDKFKRGQQFFHKHIWAMFFSKIMGLVTILCVPELSDVLMFTKMSHVPLLAYKRYLQTIFHMYIWYNEDFCTESKIWKSICKVRFKHNQASQRSRSSTKIFISQKNMAVTQFGFMGFAVWRTKLVGIHEVEEDELEAFIHFWKVIGHLMGIEDRFNICRDSVEETRKICNELAVQIFKPEILKKHQNFLDLSYALLTGMWCMMPLFQYKAFIQLTANIITSSTPSTNSKIHKDNNKNYIENLSESVDFELNAFENFYLKSILLFLSLFRFTIIRVFHRYVIYISIWLMENFPFLAYYKFGKANSHVKILD